MHACGPTNGVGIRRHAEGLSRRVLMLLQLVMEALEQLPASAEHRPAAREDSRQQVDVWSLSAHHHRGEGRAAARTLYPLLPRMPGQPPGTSGDSAALEHVRSVQQGVLGTIHMIMLLQSLPFKGGQKCKLHKKSAAAQATSQVVMTTPAAYALMMGVLRASIVAHKWSV